MFHQKADIFYGLRLLMLELAYVNQVVIVAGTSSKSFYTLRNAALSPILPNVAAALTAIRDAHAQLPIPPQVGSVMRLPERKS